MKKIYLVLTHSGTVLSRIIKVYTGDEFSHISLALDENLSGMYSFGRQRLYNPLIAGFVCEHINSGFFKRFQKTVARVNELEITDEQYEVVKELISKMEEEKKYYRFNMLGLIAVGFHIRIKRKRSFYCAEFIKYIMENAEINRELPRLIKPENFKELHGTKQIYKGLLNMYSVPCKTAM